MKVQMFYSVQVSKSLNVGFYFPNKGLRGFHPWSQRYNIVYICYLPAGRSVLGKLCPPRAVLKTKGTIFPNMDRPRPANNVFIFFSLENYFIFIFLLIFYCSSFTPCACVWRFGQVNSCCLLKYLKEEIQFSLILNWAINNLHFMEIFSVTKSC